MVLCHCVRKIQPNWLRKGGQMSGLEICLEAKGDGSHSSISRVTVIGVALLLSEVGWGGPSQKTDG